MAKKERISAQEVLETLSGFMELLDGEKLKKLDKLDDLSSIKANQEALEKKITSMEQKMSEFVKPEDFEQKLKRRDEAFNKAIKDVPTTVKVKNDPVCLAQEDRDMLHSLKFQLEKKNQRFSMFCQIISDKKIWFFYFFLTVVMSIEGTVLVMKNSEQAWAHRALVAAEKIHNEDPSAEYFKAFIDMQSNRKDRKAAKKRIEGMEYAAKYIKRLESILYGYTEEDVEVREYKYRVKSERMVYLVCYHPSSAQKVNYRLHTTPEGEVTKVEREKKTKSKVVWVELKRIEKNQNTTPPS
jgi:hypothetical protein